MRAYPAVLTDGQVRIDAWSVFKVVLGCSVIRDLDSTALEDRFPGWKETMATSYKVCREDHDSEKQGHAPLHSGEELTLAWYPEGLSSWVRTVLLCFLTLASILSRTDDPVRVPHPGTWPEANLADSG